MMKNLITAIVLLFTSCWVFGQKELNLVPMPVSVEFQKSNFYLDSNTRIIYLSENDFCATYLKQALYNILNINLRVKKINRSELISSKFRDNSIILTASPKVSLEESFTPEGYTLAVKQNNIIIHGFFSRGVFAGTQTLIQLLANQTENSNKKNHQLSIPQLTIKDYPRFQYRGMHLDVARHFMPVDLVKKYIDYLAMYKLNTFHWHLTDDQGWRIEIKKYPRLTEAGGWRNGTIVGAYPGTGNDSIHYGGFYTQEQIKEVVQYAADRYITVIPEIEMPGHASAAIAAYPELSCFPGEDTQFPKNCAWAGPTKGKQVQQTWGVFDDVFCPSEYTFNFLQDVIDEVITLFPSQYIHIGGDECPKESWKRSAFCQQLMKEKGLKDEHELQSYFIQRMEKYINSKGKKIIGWDEILEGGLAPNATVMSWRGEAGGIAAAKQKHDVIMTPEYPLYINHSQTKNEDSVTQGGYNPIEAVYNYEPIPKELTAEEEKYILGAQGNVWSEYIDSKSKLEYTIFPRMAALAEVLWTPKERRDWKDFERRLPVIMERLDKEKINYSKAYYEPDITIKPTLNFEGILINGSTRMPEAKLSLTNKGCKHLCYDDINNPIKHSGIYELKLYHKVNPNKYNKKWSTSFVEEVFRETIQLHFNKATGKKISLSYPAHKKYPGDGAFTLVNGVQSSKGLSRSSEYLGFNGNDCEAIIDLGKADSIGKVIIHSLNDNGAWIWKPSMTEVFVSDDGINFISAGTTTDYIQKENATGTMTVNFNAVSSRYVKVLISNYGIIAAGNAGAGSAAWLFVDEIEVE